MARAKSQCVVCVNTSVSLRLIKPLAEGDVAGMLGGKVALVTDGGHRACHCASHGAEGGRVAVADFDAASARDTVAKINEAGGQAITLTGDLSRADDVRAMVQDTITAYGRLDCTFNNAGIAPRHVGASGKKTADWAEDARH
jgi:NAD(P)-dependent dehydrogenase (short-subunit alcohol dehydrogenase family)